MAKFGTDVTNMSDPNLGSAGFIRQPTVDNSAGVLWSTLGTMAGEAYSGYNLSELDTEIKKAGEEYKARDLPEQEVQQGMAEAAGLRKGVDNIWDTLDDVNMDNVNKMETSIQERLKKYKNAYEQGRMSSDELIAKINTATKAAIARQPGLARELVSQAEFYSNLSGVTDQIAAARAREKAQQQAIDEVRKAENELLKEYGNPINIDDPMRQENLAYAREQTQAAKKADNVLKQVAVLKANGELKREVVSSVVNSPDFTKTAALNLVSLNSTTGTNLKTGAYIKRYAPDGMSPADANARGISEEYDKQIIPLQAMAGNADEAGRRTLESYIKQLQDSKQLQMKIAAGGIEGERAQNYLNTAKATAQLPFVTLEQQLQVTNQFAAALGKMAEAGMTVQNPQQYRNVLSTLMTKFQNFSMGLGENPLVSIDVTTKDGQVAQTYIFSSQDPDKDTLRPREEVIKANDVNMNQVLGMMEQLEDDKAFLNHLDKWTNTIVSESMTSKTALSTRYSPQTVERMNKFFHQAFSSAQASGKIEYDKDTNIFHVVGENGIPNSNATTRVNTYFKAWLSLNGVKVETEIDKMGGLVQKLTTSAPTEPPKQDMQTAPVKREPLGPKVEKAVSEGVDKFKEDVKTKFKDIISPKPTSGLSVREATIDLNRRLQKLKTDKKAGRVDQETYDKRLRALQEEGNRLSKMNQAD